MNYQTLQRATELKTLIDELTSRCEFFKQLLKNGRVSGSGNMHIPEQPFIAQLDLVYVHYNTDNVISLNPEFFDISDFISQYVKKIEARLSELKSEFASL